MQRNLNVPNEKKTDAKAKLANFGLTVTDDSKENILVVNGSEDSWKLFDAANQAAAQAGAVDMWASLAMFGNIAKQYGLSAIGFTGKVTRGAIEVLGSDVTKTTLKEVAGVGATAAAVVAEVGATAAAAIANKTIDGGIKAYNSVKNDADAQALVSKGKKVIRFMMPKTGSDFNL